MRNHATKIHKVPISTIKSIDNSRLHPQREIEELCKSIEHYGFTVPLLVSKADNTLIAGYARLEAAKKLGMEEVPVLMLDLKESEYVAYAILDNRLADMGTWDYAALIRQITEIEGELPVGFSDTDIADLKHFQEEAQSGLDLEDFVEKKKDRSEQSSREIVEIVLTVPMETWEERRTEIDGELASMVLKISGMKYTPPKIKTQRAKK